MLPSLGLTGIGGLPHAVDDALRISFDHEVPFFPTSSEESMVRAAIEGLPGLRASGELNLEEWRAGRDRFTLELLGPEGAWLPEAPRWSRFLDAIDQRRPPFAKTQLAGPVTVLGQLQAEGELREQMVSLLRVRAVAMVRAVRRAGATPVLFLDEPSLQVSTRELAALVQALKLERSVVGLHCCGRPDWASVFGLGVDVISFDARLSVDAIAEARVPLQRFVEGGGQLAIGIIPTGPGPRYVVSELVDSVLLALGPEIVRASVLSPACGLGLLPIADADRVLGELRSAQSICRGAL